MPKLLQIPLPNNFAYVKVSRYLQRSPLERLHHIDDEGLSKLIPSPDGPLLIRLLPPQTDHWPCQLLNATLNPMRARLIEAYVKEWFDLDRDLTPFYQMAEQDTLLGPVIKQLVGLRLVGVPDLFEAVCWAIIGQQINLAFAYTLKGRLIELAGESILHNGQIYWRFPQPEAVAALQADQLQALSFSRSKTQYLMQVAEKMAEGALSRNQLEALGHPLQIEAALTSIRGIGPWTAHYVMMRCLRVPVAFPVGDAGLQNAVKRLLSLPEKPRPADLLELARPWAGWEAYATFYLWQA